jgi:hypothetical protein
MFSQPKIFQHFMEEIINLGLHVITLMTLDATDPPWHGTTSAYKATYTRMQ